MQRPVSSRKTSSGRGPRMVIRTRQTMSRRMVIAASSAFIVLATLSLVVYFQFAKVESAYAAANGDYRSKQDGNWSSSGTWQKYNGSSWANATAAPTSSDGVITIQDNHKVTITSSVTVDQVIIASGGEVVLNSSITLTIANGSGTDFDVTGIYKSAGTTTINSSATVAFQSGGVYEHNQNGGTVLTASWNANSTCEIIGLTTTYPSGMGQTFGHVTFNSTPTSNTEMTSNLACSGNLTMSGSGSKVIQLTNSSANRTISVGGNFEISSGKFTVVDSSGTGSLTVTGDFTVSGGTFNLKEGAGAASVNVTGNFSMSGGTLNYRTLNTTSTATITVSGNFSLTSGTFDMSAVAAIGTLNVAGNFTHTGGNLKETSTGSGAVVFNGTGTQSYTSGGTVNNTINFTVNTGAILSMGTNKLGDGGSGTFTLSTGATLMIGDPSGITSSASSGNIRTSGSRSYHAGATYIYNGTAAQTTGNGLPSTIANLTINNCNGVTLSATTSVSNLLTLTSGLVTTSSYELKVTNTSASSIAGYSSSSYVVGNLRRSVTGTGTYDFPLGTSSKYELGTITLASATGFTDILGKFTNSNPLLLNLPLVSLVLNGIGLSDILDYGYWTFSPNTSMTGGTYSVSLFEQGFSDGTTSSQVYTVLKRSSSLASWQSLGTHVSSGLVGSTVSAVRSGLTSFSDFAIGYGDGAPSMVFKNSTLISGTAGQVNATYKFPNVTTGVDAQVKITDIASGAVLSGVDNYSSGDGYDNAWQPFVESNGNSTSSIGWLITFKKAGTTTDTSLANVALTAIDVDGGGSSLKEFAEAGYPYSYSVSGSSEVTVSITTGAYRGTSTTGNTIEDIDSSHTEAMFQINYRNVNNFTYRTGTISTQSSDEVRQHSILFKSFFTSTSGSTTLPIELIYFKSKVNNDYVDLSWATAAEINNDYFTVERSSNGKDFEEILRKPGAGNSTKKLSYAAYDPSPLKGISYYRLKQTDYDGKFTYSPAKAIEYGVAKTDVAVSIETIGPNPFRDSFNINYNVASQGNSEVQIMSSSGQLVFKETIYADKGFNTYIFNDQAGLPPGIYIVNLISNGEAVTKKLIKQ